MKAKLLLCLLLFVAHLAQAQKAARPEVYMPLLLDSAGVPGLAMAVVSQKGVVWAKGFGVREASKPALIDQQTVFSAASLGKLVFAYLVLKLVDEGKIDLDKPLYQYVPYRAIEHDERYKAITARMVLSHQTGFPNWRNGQLNLLFEPGHRFSYSGEGFVYLQGVVMTVMGKEVEELAQQYVFKPLGMSRSSYRWQPAFESNYATPHNRFGQPTAISHYEENVAYSLQTTAADYGRFLVALLTGEGLKPATAQALFSPQVTTGQTLHDTTQASASMRWGLGVGLVQEAGNQAFWHWGDNGNFRGFAYVSRTRKQGVVYFTNSRNGLSLLAAVPTRALGEPVSSIADFLAYDSYQSTPVQVSRNLLKKGVAASAAPFLNKQQPQKRQLAEIDLLDIADHLSDASQLKQAAELLELGGSYYLQSTKVPQALAFTYLKLGNYAQAKTALSRYVAQNPGDEAAQHILTQLSAPAAGNVTLRLPGFPAAHLVMLAGSFNNWQPLHTLFLKEGNEWRCTLNLPKGKYLYKIIVDGNWQPDPTNPNTEKDNTGNSNSVLMVES